MNIDSGPDRLAHTLREYRELSRELHGFGVDTESEEHQVDQPNFSPGALQQVWDTVISHGRFISNPRFAQAALVMHTRRGGIMANILDMRNTPGGAIVQAIGVMPRGDFDYRVLKVKTGFRTLNGIAFAIDDSVTPAFLFNEMAAYHSPRTVWASRMRAPMSNPRYFDGYMALA